MAGRGDGSSGSGTRGWQHSRRQQAGRRQGSPDSSTAPGSRTAAGSRGRAARPQAAQAGRTAAEQAAGSTGRSWRGLESAARPAHASTADERQPVTRQDGSSMAAVAGPVGTLWKAGSAAVGGKAGSRRSRAAGSIRQRQRVRQRGKLAGRRWDHARRSVKGCRERARAPSLCPSEALCGRNPAQGR